MTDDTFWNYIDLLDWSKEENDAIIAPLVHRLRIAGAKDIIAFEATMTDKLRLLDTFDHASRWLDDDGEVSSVDQFLYACAAVVANGEAVFSSVLFDPALFPDDVTFEPLLEVAELAYR